MRRRGGEGEGRRGAGEGRGEEEERGGRGGRRAGEGQGRGGGEGRGGREGGGKDNVHEYVMNVVFFYKTFPNVRSSDRF